MENPDAAKSSAEFKIDLVAKLIDNKRKHIERKLSTIQRDAILLEEEERRPNVSYRLN